MNCLVAVSNGLVLFSTGMRIIAFDFCAPVNMVCVIMSCWEIDIESLSAHIAGFEPRSLACKAKLYGFKYYCGSLFPFDYLVMLTKKLRTTQL